MTANKARILVPLPALLRTDDKPIAVDVFENVGCAPIGFLRLHLERHTFAFEFADCPLDVVCPERDVHLCAWLEPVIKAKKYDAGICSGNSEFNPALFFVEGLIG